MVVVVDLDDRSVWIPLEKRATDCPSQMASVVKCYILLFVAGLLPLKCVDKDECVTLANLVDRMSAVSPENRGQTTVKERKLKGVWSISKRKRRAS